MNLNIKNTFVQGILILLCLSFVVSSCKENIDKDNYAIAKKQTLSDYIASTDSLSDIKHIFDIVTLGKRENASSITSVLAARGNYTVFAPTNKSVRAFLLENTGKENLSDLSTELADSIAELIAYNCVIDNGKDMSYESPDFPSQGSFPKPNLNDRLLTCKLDSTAHHIINEVAVVIKENVDTENGTLHMVNHVIAPSADHVAAMVQSADNMKIMGALLQHTGWYKYIESVGVQDKIYEETEHEEAVRGDAWNCGYTTFKIPQKRFFGYTIFAETDDVFKNELGISPKVNDKGELTNWDEIESALVAKAESVYGTEAKGDFTHPNNALNRFVSYHILPFKVPYDKLVTHFCEYGYQYKDPINPQLEEFTVDVYDYYATATMYKRQDWQELNVRERPGLLKLIQTANAKEGPKHGMYLNRVSKYDDGLEENYEEKEVVKRGVLVSPDNGKYDNNAINGYYFPIDRILIEDDATRDALSSERIRFDINSTMPELMSNALRGGNYACIPHGYVDALSNISESTVIGYLHSNCSNSGLSGSWQDYQGDEFLFSGLFDFTLKMPPVPKLGTYEIRIGISQNTLRGMAQLYFGEDPYRLQPTGLPIDMRQSVSNSVFPALNWRTDKELNMNMEAIVENDKNLRNQGYMKAPQYFQLSNGTGKAATARELPFGKGNPAVRRIVTVQRMEPGKVYYIRFKSALHKTNSQFFLDYFEYVPSNVYNGAEIENVW